MLHVHDPAEPKLDGQILTITANGGQRVTGVYRHAATMRFPFPLPTPFTINASSEAVVNYRANLRDFIPSLENFTRGEIRSKIINHAADPEFGSSTLYIDYFFEDAVSGQFMDPGETFQCPNGPNTWWKYGIDDPDDFDEHFHWIDFTFVNSFSTVTVPLTTHTSETAGALLAGTPMSAFLEVTPDCTMVECPSTPNTGGLTGRPTVVWSTDPAPDEVFVIDEIEQIGSLTIDTPPDLPEGAVMLFNVTMREAFSGRALSDEVKRFALDTLPPIITDFRFETDNAVNFLLASVVAQDQGASIDFVELLLSRDEGQSFAGFPMEWQRGTL